MPTEPTAPTITIATAMDDIRLRLAIADAAIAYHDRGREPIDLSALRDAWKVVERAIENYRESQR